MMGQAFIDRYRGDLDREASELIGPLITGAAENIEDYRTNTGKILAFRRARELFDELVKRANEGIV